MKRFNQIIYIAIMVIIGSAANTLLTACGGGVEDKSVFEPLSESQREELLTKDFDYVFIRAMVEQVNKKEIQLTPAQKKEFDKLTYRRLKDFISKWTEGEALKAKEEEYGKQWDAMFESYIPKVDALNDQWLEFMEDYKPENYLKIELVDITDKSEVFVGYVTTQLRLTPLKGTISDVQAYFGIDEGMMNRNSLSRVEPFSSPIVGSAGMNFNYAFSDINASKVNELPIDELLQEYPLMTRIVSLKADGKTIDYRDGYFQVPESIRTFWEKRPGKGKEWKSEDTRIDCYERVMRELVDTTMTARIIYVHDNIQREAYEDDNLAAIYYYDIAGL